MQAQETPTPTPTAPFVPEEHRRARHTPSGLFFVLGGFALAAAGAVMIVAPDITPEVAYYAKVIPERTGTTPGQICLAGLLVFGVGMIAHYIRMHVKTLLKPGMAENALIDVMADMAEVQNALRILINDQLDTRHEIAYVKQEVTDHRDDTRSNNPKDALFGLAASLDKLGVRIDKRIGEATSILQDNTYEVSSLVDSSRSELLSALDEASERTNEISGVLEELRSTRTLDPTEDKPVENDDELDENYVSDDPDALDPNYDRTEDLSGEDFIGEEKEEPHEQQSLGLLDNLDDFDDEDESYEEHEEHQPETTHHEQPQPEAVHHEQPQPEAVHHEQPQPEAVHHEQPQPEVVHLEQPQPEAVHHEQPQPEVVHLDQPQPELVHLDQPQPELVHLDQPQPELAQQAPPQPAGLNLGGPQPPSLQLHQPQAPTAGPVDEHQPWAAHVESLKQAAGPVDGPQVPTTPVDGPQAALPALPPMPEPTPISLGGQAADFGGVLGPAPTPPATGGLPPHSPSETEDQR